MPTRDENIPELLTLAHGGDAQARTDVLEGVRSYLKLLARLHLDQRLRRKPANVDRQALAVS